MPYLLCLETSGDICSVALSKGDLLICEVNSTKDFSHSENITIFIQECLVNAHINIKELNAVVISSGPGSYTGLRIAASVAKAICYAHNIPLIAIDSLTALVFGMDDKDIGDFIVPIIDARRMDVYFTIFDTLRNRISEIEFNTLEESFLKDKNKIYTFIGSGVDKLQTTGWFSNSIFLDKAESASNLIKPAMLKYVMKDFEDLKIFSPFYLKNPNITISKKQLI